MQIFKSILALQAILLAPVLADNLGGRCDHNADKEYTTCDDGKTNIMYCNGANSQWTFAYKCGQGCCYNAAPPGSDFMIDHESLCADPYVSNMGEMC
ncbi:hypothetical protein NLG97_g10826 [Lecanicillium saksenae]|uniref:Uncharacterized protein n=1 Tax=Lecanicillium saksenae TaxID=468837 RepID=A0ACC1QEJ9_9HYPO|nr:hypothetical protein NLG97_g10826 [Lecanicillium saksenae]